MSQFIAYLKYLLKAKHRRGFGIHSPYLYRLQSVIIEEELPYYKYDEIEGQRERLQKSEGEIKILTDEGHEKLMRVSVIMKQFSLEAKYAQLLFRLVNDFKPKAIAEVGTTTGVTTCYLAGPSSKTSVYAFSNQPEMSRLMNSMSKNIRIKNIQLQNGQADAFLSKNDDVDFLYVNEASAETMRNCLLSFFQKDSKRMAVVQNIHKDKTTETVWQEFVDNNNVQASMDLFQLGILIKNADLQKENFVVLF